MAKKNYVQMPDAGQPITNPQALSIMESVQRDANAARKLLMDQAKGQFKIGDCVGFTNFSYKGVVVGFYETEDGLCEYHKFPVKVLINSEYVQGSRPMISDYHHEQLILLQRANDEIY